MYHIETKLNAVNIALKIDVVCYFIIVHPLDYFIFYERNVM